MPISTRAMADARTDIPAIMVSTAKGVLQGRWKARLPLALALGALAVLMIPAARPYLQPGYQVAHDRITPFLRVEALSDALAQGQIPPRWFPEFDGGYGSPYPSFYGMAFYYVAALFHAIGIPLGSSVELTAFLTLAFSGVGMFFLARHLWGAPAGLLSAGLYVYAPYHLVDAFVRGAYSELAAFICLPFVLLFMLLWRDSLQRRWLLAGGASVAVLILTHNILSMVFLPAVPVFGLAILLGTSSPQTTHKTLLGWSLMAVLGALLSAYFWMPVVVDRGFIHTDYFLQFNYQGDFVGFGSLLTTAVTHTLTTEIGVPLLITAGAGTAAMTLSRSSTRSKRVVIICGLLALFYAFMTNHRSAFIWSRIRMLAFVQFPWRLLAVVNFFLALIAGALLGALRGRIWPWLIALTIPMVAIQIHHPLIRIPDTISQEQVDSLSACREVWGTQDYRPVWSSEAFWRSPTPPEASPQAPVLPPCDQQISLEPGGGQILRATQSGIEWNIDYTAQQPGVIRLPVFYYPPWQAEIDGAPAEVRPQAQTGLIEIAVPPGAHEIRASLGRTFSQKLGIVLSVLGVLGLGAVRRMPRWLSPASSNHSGA